MVLVKVGKHYTLDELTHSQAAARRGLPNEPSPEHLAALRQLVANVLDPLRDALARPVVISSAYRSPRVNKAVGGASSSQHVAGQAADLTVPGLTPAQVVAKIRALGLPFDQLIEEFGSWVHVSYGPQHRRQVLRARRTISGTKYEVLP